MRFFPLLLLCAAALSSCRKPAPELTPGADDKNYQHVRNDDAAMDEAVATARKTSGEFLRAFRDPKPSYREFYLKKPYPVEGSAREHMWIGDLREVDGHFTGTVANEAYETKEVRFGQTVDLRLDEISDWKYLDGDRLVGGFTIRYFYERMTPKEKKEFLREVGFTID